jgi:hypothetical protein
MIDLENHMVDDIWFSMSTIWFKVIHGPNRPYSALPTCIVRVG